MNQVGLGALLPLLLVLTSGWLLLRSRYGKTFVWWQSGYNLYFRIAFAGILCLAAGLFAATTIIGLNLADSSCGNGGANARISFQKVFFSIQCQQEILTLAAWLTLPVGALGWVIGNCWPKANSPRIGKRYKSIVQRKNFEGYITKTMEEHSFLLITLKSRKVYIGVVMDSSLQFNELDAGEQKHLRVRMTFSGYRGDADLQMHLTTYYIDKEFKEYILGTGKLSANLEVIIPVKEITSIQPFEPQIYRKFFMDRDGMDRNNQRQHDAPDSLS